MTKEEIFSIWAPAGATWSAWVKPVLFAHANVEPVVVESEVEFGSLDWLPAADTSCALVIDLPGPAGVWFGMAAARKGYRPIPLYNAAPGPAGEVRAGVPVAIVDVWSIVRALAGAGAGLRELKLPLNAPPAFLLDANRRTGETPVPGRFDNRSVSFPTDFPSANRLLHEGINRAILVQRIGSQPQADLAHTLRRWQEAGIELRVKELEEDGPAQELDVAKPSLYQFVWHRLLTLAGLRRNALGGFGGMLAESAGG